MTRSLLAAFLLAAPIDARAGCEDLQTTAIDAALGDVTAQYNLGVDFFRGECVPKDLSKAAVMWRQAAASGEISAHNNLGWLTFHGNGVSQDEREGVRLWRFAAERGHAESQSHLAWAYLKGRGVNRDVVVAYAWAKVSLESSRLKPELGGGAEVDSVTRETLQEIESALAKDQRVAAEETAREYVSKYAPAR